MAERAVTESPLQPSSILAELQLTPGMWIGDFGVGGAANFSLPAAAAVGPTGGVIMFDVLKSALSAALSQAKLRGLTNCKAVWSNLEIYGAAKGVADKSLDAGLLINVLFQSKKYKDILAEVQRMLKTGAKLVVVDWRPEATSNLAPSSDRRLPAGHIAQVAQSLGFAPLKKFSAGPDHWGLVLVKT